MRIASVSSSRLSAFTLNCYRLVRISCAVVALGGLAQQIYAAGSSTNTTLTLTSGGTVVTTVPSGAVVTLTAKVASGGSAATRGTVNFCDAAVAHCADVHILATAQVTAAGAAVVRLKPGIGTRSYKAVYVGNAVYMASVSPILTLAVTGTHATTTTLASSGTPGAYTLTATVTGVGTNNPTPSGNVTFLDTSNSNYKLGSAAFGPPVRSEAFILSQTTAIGNYPLSVATGDFNNDGIPDVITINSGLSNSNSTGGSVSVLLCVGDGTFTTSSTVPVGKVPSGVAVGDFDGDGNLDFATVNANDSTISVELGHGDGTFSLRSTIPVYGQSIVTGDFNNDGILDLAAEGSYTAILLGRGDGTFTQATPNYYLGYGQSIASADLNGDGNLDLVTSDEFSNTMSILLGNGDGTFTNSSTQNVGASGTIPFVLTGDFNQDGIPDIAVDIDLAGTTLILLGKGDGTFAQKSTISASSPGFSIGDLNADGITDVVIAETYGTRVYFGNGDGTFSSAYASDPDFLNGYGPYDVAIADFNGDGFPDIASVRSGASTMSAALNTPSSIQSALLTGVSPAGTGSHSVVASYSGDANFSASQSSPVVLTALSSLPPTYTPVSFVPTGASTGGVSPMAATADFNGDGYADLALANLVDASVSVLFGNGKGGFATPVIYYAGAGPYGIAAGDFNGDGKPDLAVVNGKNSGVSILLNNGAGGFPATPSSSYFVGSQPYGVSLADVNRDGALDMVVTNQANNTVGVLLGTGSGTFKAAVYYATGKSPFGTSVADLNRDGYPDLVVWNLSDNTIGVLLNDKTGKFAAQVPYASGSNPYGVTVGDFNGDGYPDVAVANLGPSISTVASTVSVLLNDKTGKLLPAVAYAAGRLPTSVKAADLNGDGVLDLAVTNLGDGTVSLLLGKGDGTFTPQTTVAAGNQPYSILAADLNGDGRSDLVVTSFFDNTFGVLLQTSATTSKIIGVPKFSGPPTKLAPAP